MMRCAAPGPFAHVCMMTRRTSRARVSSVGIEGEHWSARGGGIHRLDLIAAVVVALSRRARADGAYRCPAVAARRVPEFGRSRRAAALSISARNSGTSPASVLLNARAGIFELGFDAASEILRGRAAARVILTPQRGRGTSPGARPNPDGSERARCAAARRVLDLSRLPRSGLRTDADQKTIRDDAATKGTEERLRDDCDEVHKNVHKIPPDLSKPLDYCRKP